MPTLRNHQNMFDKFIMTTVLLLVSAAAVAAPRLLIAEQSQIAFVVKEMGVPVSGKFNHFQATIDIDLAQLQKSSALIKIDVGTLDTENAEADAIATGPDWLDRGRTQYAVFKSTAIRSLDNNRFEATGKLSIRNIERPIVIQFSSTDQADGKTVIVSDFEIRRSEYGIGGGVWNEGGVVAEAIPVNVRFTLAPVVVKK